MFHKITIKNNKTTPLYAGHPWVFSGALIKLYDNIIPGSIVSIVDENNTFIAWGIYNVNQSICFRALSFKENEIDGNQLNNNFDYQVQFFYQRFLYLKTHKLAMLDDNTNGYRLVNADADYLPGLIVDVYDDLAVFQIAILGMENFNQAIIKALIMLGFLHVVEKSDSESRKLEKLEIKDAIVHHGEQKDFYPFIENNITLLSNPISGQKTGFFLDQRKTRKWLYQHAQDKKVINLYSYYGGFSICSLLGGCLGVISVDSSKPAIEACNNIIKLNDTSGKLHKKHGTEVVDVFQYLQSDLSCDILICDPPGFAKHKNAIDSAISGYTRLNRLCLSKLQSGNIFITSSCSGLIKMEDFVNILKKASFLEKKPLRILEIYGADFDHTSILGFKEGEYLKTLIVQVV